MKRLLFFSTLLLLATATLSREKRAEETSSGRICAPKTPCGWQFYNPVTREVQVSVRNTYCVCRPDQHCGLDQDIETTKTIVFLCFDGEGEEDKRFT